MRPALWMAASLALGIAAAEWLRPHPMLALAAFGALMGWAALTRHRVAVALMLTVVAFGALRYSFDQTAGRGNLSAWEGRKVTLSGTVVTEPELRKPRGVAYTVSVEHVGGAAATGKIYVTQSSPQAPRFGERVELTGTLKRPSGPKTPGAFDQAAYLARQGVYRTVDTGEAIQKGPGNLPWLRRAAVATRIRLEGVLKATLPPRESALTAGLLFGTRSDLPDDIKEAFKSSGVFHLLAVSGGNVAMIVMPVLALLQRAGLSRRKASAAGIPVVIFFVFLTGAGPSVSRAGLMAGMVLLGQALRRENDAVNTLGAAAAILLLARPGLLFDIGFQLSAGATLGILLFARPIGERLRPPFQAIFGQWLGEKLAEGLSVTFAAQLLVEPISLHNFGAFSAIAPIANLMVLAIIDPIVKLGTVAAIVGVAALPVAKLLLLPVRAGLHTLVFLVKATSAVPGAYLQVGRLPWSGVLLWYAGLALVTTTTGRRLLPQGVAFLQHGIRKQARAAAILACLLLATGFTWRLALAGPPDELRVTFIDVGQGDAILIEAPGGATMLVDTGAAYPADPKTGRPGFDTGAEIILPFLRERGIRRLDYLVLTHPDLDHAGGGASILREFPVGALLTYGRDAEEVKFREALTTAATRKTPVHWPMAGERIDLGGGAVAEVLNPSANLHTGTRSDDNANCIALRVIYRQRAVLLPCDLEAVAEERLVDEGAALRADVLKASHHGSGHSSTERFVEAVQPAYAVISAGNQNRYGHPHAEALERLQQAGATIYRTDRHGNITVRTDGYKLFVSGDRGGPADDAYKPLGLLGRRWLRAW